MKHPYKIVFIIITIVVIIFLSTLDIYAYGDHKSLVTGSFDILADEKEDAYQFYSGHYIGNESYKTIIFNKSEAPDGDESINGTHYYVYEGTPSTNMRILPEIFRCYFDLIRSIKGNTVYTLC
jgi:hypothetical protein